MIGICCVVWICVVFGEYDDKLDDEDGDDGIVCSSALWLSSKSSLDRDDGGVGGKPNPI